MSKPLGKQVLADAIKLIEDPRAWTQSKFERPVNVGTWLRPIWLRALCADQALVETAAKYGGKPALEQARNLLYDHLGWQIGERGPTFIHMWNDTPGRTHQEVLDSMRGALARA